MISCSTSSNNCLLTIAGNVGCSTARYFEFDEAQRDQLPDYKGPLSKVFNCQSGTWPAYASVSPRLLMGAVRWETLGTSKLPGKYAKSISRNAHYIVAFKNPTDQLRTKILLLQASPACWSNEPKFTYLQPSSSAILFSHFKASKC